MKVCDLLEVKEFEAINKPLSLNQKISDVYSSDLLSWVMGHVKKEGTILLTVLNTINLIAVATLLEMPCIIFCEGVEPTKDIVEKANEENITLIKTKLTSAQGIKQILKYEDLL